MDRQDSNQNTIAEREVSYFLELYRYMREALENAATVPFYGKNKRLVDTEACLKILDDMYKTLPAAVHGAERAFREKDKILNDAKNEEERILSSAQARAQQQLNSANARAEASINAADDEAERTVIDAKAKASGIIEEARRQAEEMVEESEIVKAAQTQASQIVSEARAEQRERMQETANYANGVLTDLDKTVLGISDQLRTLRSRIVNQEY